MLKKIDSRWAVAGLALLIASCGKPGADNAADPSAPIAAVPPPAGSEWTDVVAATPEGGFVMGNPDAPVKFVEYASFTCPHCAQFSIDATETLKDEYIKTGKVSWEFRSFMLQPVDVAVSLLAQCQGPGPYFKLIDQVFSEQANWTAAFQTISQADQTRIQSLGDQDRIAAIAQVGGLDAFFGARGLPEAKAQACLKDQAATDTLVKIRQKAVDEGVDGTPSFFINGVRVEGVYDWSGVEPRLRAATGG